MLKRLKKIFPSLIIHSSGAQDLDENFIWFITSDTKVVGIHQNDLTNKDISILTTFLEPYSSFFPLKSEKEEKWLDIIHQPNQTDQKANKPYRFIYFNISAKQINPVAFKEAIEELFTDEIAILWENEKEGLIIEEQHEPAEETISYEQIIDILMSDLYVKINFLVGPFQDDYKTAGFYYKNMIQGGHVTFKFSDKHVMTLVDAIPFIIMEQVDPSFQTYLTEYILKEHRSDKELIRTLDVFFQSDLNISVAAKKLYMHRNSLQYRLNRFKEQTGIDVRDFHQALTVYLALIANRHL